jgi:hypothetical protein
MISRYCSAWMRRRRVVAETKLQGATELKQGNTLLGFNMVILGRSSFLTRERKFNKKETRLDLIEL